MRATVAPAAGLALVLATLGAGIALSREQSRAHLRDNLRLRGASSAVVVATFLAQQVARERQSAQLLGGASVSAERFALAVSAFGSKAAVLLDSRGRLMRALPADERLIGKPIAARYAHLTAAEHGRVAISNVVRSVVRRVLVAAVAVPFQTRYGRRVFSVAYNVSGSALGLFVSHTIPYPQHQVYLVDGAGRLVAASPASRAATLRGTDRALARALARSADGALSIGREPWTYTSAPVAGTSWRLAIAIPDSRLYMSVSGWAEWLPWIVFALVSVFGTLLLGLLARSQADRARLSKLSEQLAKTARRDPLTGLYNRRALYEHLVRMTAHARRTGTPVSVLMIDLDNFKRTNDRYGHAAGDEVLCAVAECMRDVLRGADLYGRIGGDEFLIALPDAGDGEARTVAERLGQAAAAVALQDIGLAHGIELSVGVASAVHTTPEQIVHAADAALYESKARRSASAGTAAG